MPLPKIPLVQRELTAEELIGIAGRMGQLLESPAWQTMMQMVASQRAMVMGSGFGGASSMEELGFWRGVDAGLALVATLPQEIVQAAAVEERREEARGDVRIERMTDESDTSGLS